MSKANILEVTYTSPPFILKKFKSDTKYFSIPLLPNNTSLPPLPSIVLVFSSPAIMTSASLVPTFISPLEPYAIWLTLSE